MRLHFVYAGDPRNEQLQSPYSITRNLYNALKEHFEVVYYEWSSNNEIKVDPDDIVLGHPNYPPKTPIQKFFKSGQKCRARCLIHPFHHKRVGDNWPFDPLAKEADKIFSICGRYWYDTIGASKFAHWKPKMVRVDMAVDANHFPFLREKFNEPGKRKLVYVGSSMPQKNLELMVQIMKKMGNHTLHWYGGSSDHPLAKLPNVKTIGWVTLNKQTAKKIVDECDIFLNTSISDANPTTLLEATAWGIPVVCTRESGYYNDPMFTNIDLTDVPHNVRILTNLLDKVESDNLMKRAKASREIIESKYNWDTFCRTILDGLQEFL